MRRPFPGIRNVFLFNWPYYAFGAGTLIVLVGANQIFHWPGYAITAILVSPVILLVAISLLVTFYVYDISGLYKMRWLEPISTPEPLRVVNVTAGFDETSALLSDRFSKCELKVFDFFDPKQHTEPSIRRARAAYPQFPETQIISTTSVPIESGTADLIVAFLSAHEIRDQTERISFFKELSRALSRGGRVVVVEHVRGRAIFLAYSIGAFHFHSRACWLATFQAAGLEVKREVKETPFITIFTLGKIGN
jgi:hypothetical protein